MLTSNERMAAAKCLFESGLIKYRANDLDGAEADFTEALVLAPSRISVIANLASVKLLRGNVDEGIHLANQTIALIRSQGADVEPALRIAETLANLTLYASANMLIDEILDFPNVSPFALLLKGKLLLINKLYAQAADFFQLALQHQNNLSDALEGLGVCHGYLENLEISKRFLERALVLDPKNSRCLYHLGWCAQKQGNWQRAAEYYLEAIEIDSQNPKAFYNLGLVQQNLLDFSSAIQSYISAIKLDPSYADAYTNLAWARLYLNDYSSAIESFHAALDIDGSQPYVSGALLFAKMQICDWTSFNEARAQLVYGILNSQRVAPLFPLMLLFDDPKLQFLASQIYVEDKFSRRNFSIGDSFGSSCDRIKVAYYSSDFHEHATSYLIAELFELHDRSKFEVFGFSYGPVSASPIRARLERAFDNFFEVSQFSDASIVELSRDLRIDIAIDLKGFTWGGRFDIFQRRVAPIQISFLGYPGTLVAPFIDYVIADEIVIPKESACFFSEKIIYLPNCYQINDRKRFFPSSIGSASVYGLPEGKFIFCCFNNNFKILPSILDVWCDILKSVPNGILWLLEDNNFASENLKRYFEAAGISTSRIFFAKRTSFEKHLSRQAAADLFLDTSPYNAHTTASDALWVGLPVITLLGKSFQSRVCASLLHAVGLPELIVDDWEGYKNLAIKLAMNPGELKRLKDKLVKDRMHCKLFDSRLFTRHFEAGLIKAKERFWSGFPAEHIYVEEFN